MTEGADFLPEDDELLSRLKAALAEPCVAVRLVHTAHGGCADFDVLDLLRLVGRLEELEARWRGAKEFFQKECTRLDLEILRGEMFRHWVADNTPMPGETWNGDVIDTLHLIHQRAVIGTDEAPL